MTRRSTHGRGDATTPSVTAAPSRKEHVRQSNVGPRCIHPSRVGPPILEHRRGVKAGGVRNVRRSVNEIEVRRVVLSV